MSIFEKDNVVIFGLSASKEFSQLVCEKLNIKLGEIDVSRFADGEFNIQLKTSVRGKEVYLIQSTSPPVNENLMELLITIDALMRASAAKIHAVIPYFGYARQDRKMTGRQPITCKLIANLLATAGINRLMTVDLHSPQEQGYFDIPVDDLRSTQDLAAYIIKQNLKNLVVVSPDHGGVTRARRLGNFLNCSLAVIDKRRVRPNESEVKFVLGDVKGKNAIIIDDMIDTGGTIINAAKAIKKHGAKTIHILATHGLFSVNAVDKFKEAISSGDITEVVVTDTISIPKEKQFKGLKVISISDFLAEMIAASIANKSLTKVYDSKNKTLVKD
ncbi:MAG: ribose-phosphate diphosphokinase [Spiroplasma sp.]